MTRFGPTLLVLVTSAALFSACSDDTVTDSATGGTGSQAEGSSDPENAGSDLPDEDEVEAYFDAASTHDVVALDRAVKLAEKDSVAEAYAAHLLAYANASLDGGTPLSGSLVDPIDDGFESCDDEGCVRWADIRGRDGKLVDFTVNGESLEGRMSAGDGTRVAAGELAQVTMVSAYKSVTSEGLDVVAEVRTGGVPIKLGLYEATYRSPEGRETVVAEFVGPSSLDSRSTATVVMSFPDADIGGLVTAPIFSSDFQARRTAVLAIR